VQRRVPGRDAADDADRLADEQRAAVAPLELELLDGVRHVRERQAGHLPVHEAAIVASLAEATRATSR
jgi:hypothetical protein